MSVKNSFKTSLADSRSRSIAIIFIGIAVIAVMVGLVVYRLAAPSTGGNVSQVGQAPERIDNSVSDKDNQHMQELIEEQDNTNAQAAAQSGKSMVATLTSMANSKPQEIPEPRHETRRKKTEHTLKEVAPAQIKPPKNTHTQTKKRVAPEHTQQEPNMSDRAERMADAMANIVSHMQLSDATLVSLNSNSQKVAAAQQAEQQEAMGDYGYQIADTSATPPQQVLASQQPVENKEMASPQKHSKKPMIQASTVMYAVMEMTADSDVPGPIMARIVAGPYRGARLIGQFQKSNKKLRIAFNKMTLPDTGTISIQTIAVNPNNTSVGMATYVNSHYLQRYGGLFLGGFIQGIGKATEESGRVVALGNAGGAVSGNPTYSTTDQLKIAGASAMDAMSDQFTKLADREPTVRVASGTPIGVLFLSDVDDPNE